MFQCAAGLISQVFVFDPGSVFVTSNRLICEHAISRVLIPWLSNPHELHTVFDCHVRSYFGGRLLDETDYAASFFDCRLNCTEIFSVRLQAKPFFQVFSCYSLRIGDSQHHAPQIEHAIFGVERIPMNRVETILIKPD